MGPIHNSKRKEGHFSTDSSKKADLWRNLKNSCWWLFYHWNKWWARGKIWGRHYGIIVWSLVERVWNWPRGKWERWAKQGNIARQPAGLRRMWQIHLESSQWGLCAWLFPAGREKADFLLHQSGGFLKKCYVRKTKQGEMFKDFEKRLKWREKGPKGRKSLCLGCLFHWGIRKIWGKTENRITKFMMSDLSNCRYSQGSGDDNWSGVSDHRAEKM